MQTSPIVAYYIIIIAHKEGAVQQYIEFCSLACYNIVVKVYIVKDADKQSAIEKVKIAYANDVGKELVWNYDAQGKPISDGCNLSISHTSGVYVLAVSDRGVGVDIESQSRQISPKLGDIRLWTQKEAYGKMLGTGLTRDIVESFEGDDRVQTIDLDGKYWLSTCSEDRELKIVRL